jgi:single-strand DNA-binding protein
MRTLNSVQLIGRLGRDPELKYLGSGKAVTTVTLATNSNRKDANGAWQEETEWHSLVAWDTLAETLNEYGRKGSLLFVSGRLQTRAWEKDGQKHSKTEVVISDLILLDPKSRGEAIPGDDGSRAGRLEADIDDGEVPF